LRGTPRGREEGEEMWQARVGERDTEMARRGKEANKGRGLIIIGGIRGLGRWLGVDFLVRALGKGCIAVMSL